MIQVTFTGTHARYRHPYPFVVNSACYPSFFDRQHVCGYQVTFELYRMTIPIDTVDGGGLSSELPEKTRVMLY